MLTCLLFISMLTPPTYQDQERLYTCIDLIDLSDQYMIPPALVLSVSWFESNWLQKLDNNGSNCYGPLQIKSSYWCENKEGIWNKHKKDGLLKSCDLANRGLFALSYYIDKYPDIDNSLCHFGGCTKERRQYIKKIKRLFKRLYVHIN